MTAILMACTMMVALGGADSIHAANPGDGQPLKYISSCEIDLNADGEADIAILVETVRGWELIALMKTSDGYNSYVVTDNRKGMYLYCHYGYTVTEFPFDDTKSEAERTYKTPGTFLELVYPESSAVAYFWNGNGFTEVWTSD
jgi:hypothetical protein